jgi:hypothetical protein
VASFEWDLRVQQLHRALSEEMKAVARGESFAMPAASNRPGDRRAARIVFSAADERRLVAEGTATQAIQPWRIDGLRRA